MRVAVTGGSGRIGSYTVRELQEHGYEVRNLDAAQPSQPDIPTTVVDITRLGELVSVLRGFDAIIHLAAIVAPGRIADHEIFRVNALGTWNILEAASILGIENVCIASSINALGMAWNLETRFQYLPLDEDHPCQPDEAYSLSKQVGEILADGFVLRFPQMKIACMRYPAVFTPEIYQTLDRESSHRRSILWSYADVREVARANRMAIEADWDGHEVFFIAADHTLSQSPTLELVAEYFPGVEVRAELTGNAALISSKKAERFFDWKHDRHIDQILNEFPPDD